MSLNRREIGQIARALGVLEGGFVQKIQLCAPLRLFIELRQPGQSFRLFICSEGGAARLHLCEDREASPAQPLAFLGLLRAHLMGARLARLEQIPGERAVALSFQSKAACHRLIAELMGRQGNLFLLDEADRILGSAVPARSVKRDLCAGALYRPPRRSADQSEDQGQGEASRFEGMSDAADLSREIASCYRERERRAQTEAARLCRLKPLCADLKKALRALDKARADLERCSAADGELWRGSLLKANMHRLAKGQRSVRLIEYTPAGAQEVEVELNPALTPQQEVEAAFRRYRRWTGGRDKASARCASLAARVSALEAQIAAIEAMTDAEFAGDSALLSQEDRTAQGQATPALERTVKAPSAGALPFREYRSAVGQRIWVGRSAKHNDALTFKCAKGNDVWLHVRGQSGSHVIVPLARGEALHDETRRDACQLARHFSNARGEAAEVSWTRVKFVRRQKGGPPGAVTYSQEKTALIRPDAVRLDRLLGRAQA